MTLQELRDMPVHSLGKVNDSTSVLRVPGGWLYRGLIGSTGVSTFVPEPVLVDKECSEDQRK